MESTELELSPVSVLEKDVADAVAELEMNPTTAVTATPSAEVVEADANVALVDVASAHARDETDQPALELSDPELSPVSALEKQLADAMAELEMTRAAVAPTPAAVADVTESATDAASSLGNDGAVVGATKTRGGAPAAVLERHAAPHLQSQPLFPIGARVSVPTVGYVGCVVEGVVSTAEGYLYTLRARGIPTLEGVSEVLLK